MGIIRIGWIGAVCLLGLLPACGLQTQLQAQIQPQEKPQAATPAIEVSEERFEFAPVAEGSDVTHEFRVRNSGDAPLVIERVRTG